MLLCKYSGRRSFILIKAGVSVKSCLCFYMFVCTFLQWLNIAADLL